MRKIVSLVLLFTMILGCGGIKHVSNLPPGVSETEVKNWYTATGVMLTIASSSKAGTDAVIAWHNSGNFPGGEEYYQQVLVIFAKIDQAGLHANSVLKSQPEHFGQSIQTQVSADLMIITNELQRAMTDATITNNSTLKGILLAIQTGVGIANSIMAVNSRNYIQGGVYGYSC